MPNQAIILVGCAAQIYFNTGTFASPTWVNQGSVKDVDPKSGWVWSDKAQSRITPVALYAKTTIDLPIDVTMREDPLDADFVAWMNLHWNRAGIQDTMVLNASVNVNGAQGWRGPYLYSKADGNQPIEGVIYAKFELRPTIDVSGNVVEEVVVVAGSPTYDALSY